MNVMSQAKFIYICFKNSKKPISFHDAIVQGKILINFLISIWVSGCCTLLMTINLWKNWIDFVKIKFHLIETIEWHCMQLEFNPIPIELNPTPIELNPTPIELNPISVELNWIQQDSNSIEEKWDAKWWKRYWKFTYEYGVGNFLLQKQIQKDTIPCLFTWKWAKHILIWNFPSVDFLLMIYGT